MVKSSGKYKQLIDATKEFYDFIQELDIGEVSCLSKKLVYDIENWTGNESKFESKEYNDGMQFIIYKYGNQVPKKI